MVVQNIVTRKEYGVSQEVCDLLLYATKPRTASQLLKRLEKHRVDKSNAKNTFSLLLNAGILAKSGYMPFSNWLQKNWRNALYFHEATRNQVFADHGQNKENEIKKGILQDYSEEGALNDFFKEYSGKHTALPVPNTIARSFGKSLLARRTSRNFSTEEVKLVDISVILSHALYPALKIRQFAEENFKKNPLLLTLSEFTPFEVYMVAFNISGLRTGVYHYNLKHHSLKLIRKGNYREVLKKIAIGQGVDDCAGVFLITSRFGRYMWRYRNSRALRNLYMDCSALAHRIVLCATGLKLRNFLTPAIKDTLAENLLKTRFDEESPTYLVGIGK